MSGSGRWVWALAPLLAGCGELAGADWRGERLFTISGDVLSLDPWSLQGNLRVALFWAWDDEHPVEQSVVVDTSFPAHYELEVYAWPPEESMFQAPWSSVPLAAGVPLLYDDADLDGRYDEGEALVGGPQDAGVLYVPPVSGATLVSADPTVPTIPITSGFRSVPNDLQTTLCGDLPFGPEILDAEIDRTDLYVGPFWIHFTDWNCDTQLDEWTDACPTTPGDPAFEEFCVDQAYVAPDGSFPCADACAALLGG